MGEGVNYTLVVMLTYFMFQRQATKDAGTIAGLTCCVSLTNSQQMQLGAQCPDLRHGRRYLRHVLPTVEDGAFEVKASAGDMHLGKRTLTTA